MSAPRFLAALASGLLFGLGLALSGMMDPRKVLGFLDVAGAWDPSLAFVLAGAVGVSALGYLGRARLARPLLAPRFEVPANRRVDARLLAGAALFGIGWGLAGFCPGPALAGLVLGLPAVAVFVAAMLAGMALHRVTLERRPDTDAWCGPRGEARSVRPGGARRLRVSGPRRSLLSGPVDEGPG